MKATPGRASKDRKRAAQRQLKNASRAVPAYQNPSAAAVNRKRFQCPRKRQKSALTPTKTRLCSDGGERFGKGLRNLLLVVIRPDNNSGFFLTLLICHSYYPPANKIPLGVAPMNNYL
jgi:hypothetical protein